MTESKIIVVGAGVVGLTTAIVLLRAGLAVEIIAREATYQTNSAAAAAFWYPYHADPVEKVEKWGAISLKTFKELTRVSNSGVVVKRFLEVMQTADCSPWWADLVDNFVTAKPYEIPDGYKSGFWFDIPIIDTTLYLPYLVNCVVGLGGTFRSMHISSWQDLLDETNIIVNCAGMGARELTADRDLHPAKGQVLSIRRSDDHRPMIDLTGGTHMAHITPRYNDTILGGTYLEDDESLVVDPEESAAIIERCRKIFPELRVNPETDILMAKCGLRPVRSQVRLETEQISEGKFVVHNYGHGGAGFTLSWGCAHDVEQIVGQLCRSSRPG